MTCAYDRPMLALLLIKLGTASSNAVCSAAVKYPACKLHKILFLSGVGPSNNMANSEISNEL